MQAYQLIHRKQLLSKHGNRSTHGGGREALREAFRQLLLHPRFYWARWNHSHMPSAMAAAFECLLLCCARCSLTLPVELFDTHIFPCLAYADFVPDPDTFAITHWPNADAAE